MLRHQLNVYQRRQPRPKLRPMDRFLWAWVSRIWPGWREELTLARISRAPCKGTVFQWVRIPPGNFRSSR